MTNFELISPCHFGLERVLKNELLDIGATIEKVEDGKITYSGDESLVARANMFLRTTERVLIKVASFQAETFEELFVATKEIAWEKYFPSDAKFTVAKVTSIKSKLFSPSDIQSIMKKAMVERLRSIFNISWFPETGATYPLRVTIMNDIVTIGLDTSGVSLHKRGYRKLVSKAPITETLAAALIKLTPWNKDRILVDPFCGSGTIPIEAALIGLNIAPGIKRDFLAETWKLFPKKIWDEARIEAHDLIRKDCELSIQGFDIDSYILQSARENAKLAGVFDKIHFQARPIKDLSHPKKYGFIITNPPYGERIEEKENLPIIYEQIGQGLNKLDTWSLYVITAYEDAQKYIGKKATKNRKIYNGMMKTYLYEYQGPKPPKIKPV